MAHVCSLLNRHEARYVVIGGQACILHGLVRTTEDVDILVEDNDDNFRRVIAALSELPDHAAVELTPADLRDNVVVKVADQVEVDISRSAWKVSFEEASKTVQHLKVENVDIPYAGLDALIASKETYRDQDRVDVIRLKELARRQQPPAN
ncbi:MAG: DUF6036 family nucleotidyltransferase [bacterium]